jgi:hypothetical protein
VAKTARVFERQDRKPAIAGNETVFHPCGAGNFARSRLSGGSYLITPR